MVTLLLVDILLPLCQSGTTSSPSILSTVCDDATMALSTIPQSFASEGDGQASVRTFIESTLTDLVHQLSLPPDQAQPSITLRCRATPTSCFVNRVSGALEARRDADTSRTYTWPGDSAYESWKFSMFSCALGFRLDLECRTKQESVLSCDTPNIGNH